MKIKESKLFLKNYFGEGMFLSVGNRYARTRRPLHLPSFCLVVMPFFLFAALAAVFSPGNSREAERSVLPPAVGLAVGQITVPLPDGMEREDAPAAAEDSDAGPPAADPAPAEELPAARAYDFSKPVPTADIALTEDYFEDAVFIGDSRTEGFQLYSGPQNAAYYHSKGLKVDTIFSREVVKTPGGQKITIFEALQREPFQKVYIMLGINELGWVYSDLFIKKYAEVIAEIRKIKPEAQIYVQSILPVTKKRSQSDEIYNNTNIRKYNELIQQMAAEKKVYYLDVARCVADGEGNLCSDASTDGIHLNKAYCDLWLDYLRHHYVAQE